MSADKEHLEPTPFELAPAPAPLDEPGRTLPGWVLPALTGLLLLALLVIFWLPQQVDPTATEEAVTAGQGAGSVESPPGQAVTAAAPEPAAEASPWSDAQAAKLRKEAQDVLQQLLDLQFALEERNVTEWAGDDYARAGESASAGDELYRQRQYVEAKTRYEESLAILQAISDRISAVMDEQLALARQGIEAGDTDGVNAALALASSIEPENAELAALQERAAVLEPLLEHIDSAAAAERAGDLATARASLKQATELDPLHQRAAAEFERVSAAYLDQRFNDAMSDGYSALDNARFDRAREFFREASRLQAGSQEAASALLEVDSAQQAARLTSLKQTGAQREQSEQWQKAVAAYEQAVAIDGSVSYAVEGLERARARAQLDKQFRTALTDPGRLSDVAVAEAAEKLLARARDISPPGPLLKQQMAQLEVLLEQANTLVPVTFTSDAETEVIIYKVARLGKFQKRELALRPGSYKVRGSRNGYRDVLETIRVSHEGMPDPIYIACRDAIL